MQGQAYEVFRLLIAAVVAGAVLMTLIGLLQRITTPTTDPQSTATEIVRKYIDAGGYEISRELIFGPGKAISASNIAHKVGVDEACIVVTKDSKISDGKIKCNGDNTRCIVVSRNPFRAKLEVECSEKKGGANCSGIGCTIKIVPRNYRGPSS